MTDTAALRDYNPRSFLTNLIWNTRGETQCFQFGPGDVQDIAEAVVYLAAPSGKFITGEVLNVEGGMLLWGEFWPAGKPDYFKVDQP